MSVHDCLAQVKRVHICCTLFVVNCDHSCVSINPSGVFGVLGVSGLKEKSAHVPLGTEVHALDSSWPPTHACPTAVTQYPCASVASKSCMTWHD